MQKTLFAILLLFSLCLFADDADKNEEATELYEKANTEFDEQNYESAFIRYRALLNEYLLTKFVSENLDEIKEKKRECVNKISNVRLKQTKISKQEHLDLVAGIKFNPPESWRAIPPEQKLKFFADDPESYNSDGDLYERAIYLSDFSDDIYIQILGIVRPSSLDDVNRGITKRIRKFGDVSVEKGVDQTLGEKKTRKTVYKNKENGSVYITYNIFADPTYRKGYSIIGYWKHAKDTDSTPFEELLDKFIEKFQVIPYAQLQGLRSSQGRIVKIPGWSVIQTKHFYVYYDTEKEFAKKVADNLEAILALYKALLPTNKKFQTMVKVFDSAEKYHFYGGPTGSAAYYSSARDEIVCYKYKSNRVKFNETGETIALRDKDTEDVTINIIYHEAFHQFLNYYYGFDASLVGHFDIPSWLNEGLGDYFFGGRFEKGKLSIGPNHWRLKKIWKAIRDNIHVPLNEILYYDQEQYYSKAGLCYAQGWSICYFILKEPKKKYMRIFNSLISGLKKHRDIKKATDGALAGINLDKMENEWKEFITKLGDEHLTQEEKESIGDEE